MNVHSERLSKVSKRLALSGRQFVRATKFREGSGGLKVCLNFFAYEGSFHDSLYSSLKFSGSIKGLLDRLFPLSL
jgi:hypothetical protein